jgi:hypothetical protein
MIQVKYNDRVFTGEDKHEVFRKMHLAHLSLRKIRDAFTEQNERVTHETVRTSLIEQGIYNPDTRIPELEREETFAQTDEEIAARLGIPVSAVTRARKRFDLKSSSKAGSVKLARRRNWLANKLFGHKPGPKFSEFILDVIGDLPDKRAELIEEFYVSGLDSPKDKEGYERAYRKKAVSQLEQMTGNLDVKQLIENDVILA